MYQKKKFVIIGSSDSKYGDFLINHWLKSLKDNLNTKIIEIVILDYGLTEKQKKELTLQNVKVIACKRDGHILNIRYRDMLSFLNKNKYEQVMACDSGDIIFQKDITHLFNENKTEFRGVCEDLAPPMLEYTLINKLFIEKIEKDIKKVLKNKKMINGGMIISPNNKFKELCKNMDRFIAKKDSFGPDQIIVNYTLYKNGFHQLDKKYNYVIGSLNEKFIIKEGKFYKKNKELIPIVHNAGRYAFLRPIKNFGYGRNNNKFSYISYYTLRFLCNMAFILNFFNSFLRKLKSKN